MAYMPQQPHELHSLLKSVLCVSAHPDDNEFSIAGTITRWARQGREIVFVLVTSGDAGTNEPNVNLEELAQTRERESWEAARIMGVRDVVFLRYRDGVLQPTLELRRDLTRLIRRYKPDVVVCSDPTRHWYGHGYLNHPDHRAVAEATLGAVFPSAETRYIFPELLDEGFEPHRVKEVFIHSAEPPDAWIDIGDTIDVKCAALKAHRSQIGDGSWVDREMRDWAEREGEGTGIKYSESYRRMVLWDPKEAEAIDRKTEETDEVAAISREGHVVPAPP